MLQNQSSVPRSLAPTWFALWGLSWPSVCRLTPDVRQNGRRRLAWVGHFPLSCIPDNSHGNSSQTT